MAKLDGTRLQGAAQRSLRSRMVQAKKTGNIPRLRRLENIQVGREQRSAMKRPGRLQGKAGAERRTSLREDYKGTKQRVGYYGKVIKTFKGR
jgi:hypothetical protein